MYDEEEEKKKRTSLLPLFLFISSLFFKYYSILKTLLNKPFHESFLGTNNIHTILFTTEKKHVHTQMFTVFWAIFQFFLFIFFIFIFLFSFCEISLLDLSIKKKKRKTWVPKKCDHSTHTPIPSIRLSRLHSQAPSFGRRWWLVVVGGHRLEYFVISIKLDFIIITLLSGCPYRCSQKIHSYYTTPTLFGLA